MMYVSFLHATTNPNRVEMLDSWTNDSYELFFSQSQIFTQTNTYLSQTHSVSELFKAVNMGSQLTPSLNTK